MNTTKYERECQLCLLMFLRCCWMELPHYGCTNVPQTIKKSWCLQIALKTISTWMTSPRNKIKISEKHINTRWSCAYIWQKGIKSHHVNSFIDDNILDLAHLNERGCLPAWGEAGGHLNAQGADDQQRLMVYLHKVDMEHHANQGEQDGPGQDSCVLQGTGQMGKEVKMFLGIVMAQLKKKKK